MNVHVYWGLGKYLRWLLLGKTEMPLVPPPKLNLPKLSSDGVTGLLRESLGTAISNRSKPEFIGPSNPDPM